MSIVMQYGVFGGEWSNVVQMDYQFRLAQESLITVVAKKVEVDLSHVAAIPLHKRSTIRSLAEAAGLKKSTVHRLFKDGLLRRHSSTLKPYLKEANKRERLWWCLSMLDQQTLQTELKFIDMENIIHIDEKWFYITKKGKTYYLLAQEEDPHRTVHNKNYIGKVMFLVAVAKPRYDNEGNCTFDGKIGIWPFIRKVSYPTCFSLYNKLILFSSQFNIFFITCTNQQKGEVITEKGAHWSPRQWRLIEILSAHIWSLNCYLP